MGDDQTLLWVIPKIVTDWTDSEEARTAQAKFERQANSRANPGDVADTLEPAVQAVRSAYRGQRRILVPHPYHLKLDVITAHGAPALIFDLP